MQVQQIAADLANVLRLWPANEAIPPLPFLSAADRANKTVGFDGGGAPMFVSGSVAQALVSPFGGTLVAAPSPSTARDVLGVSPFGGTLIAAPSPSAARDVLGVVPAWGGTAGGTANALTVSIDADITSYYAGLEIDFISGASSNTGPVTLNVNSLGAVAVNKGDGTAALAAGDMPASAMVTAVHDGTRFRLVAPTTFGVVGRALAATETAAAAADIINAVPVDVASNALTNIGAAASPYVQITGTTPILSFGLAPAGTRRFLTFAAVLTITYNPTTLITPGLVNITTAAGDRAEARSLGSGNWVIESIQPPSGFARSGAATASGLTLAAAHILGRRAAGTGAIEEIPIANPDPAFSIGIGRSSLNEFNLSPVSVDFLNIPAGVRWVCIPLRWVSTQGTSPLLVQVGGTGQAPGDFLTTGYLAGASRFGTGASSTNFTTGIAGINYSAATDFMHGAITLTNLANSPLNLWTAHGAGFISGINQPFVTGGSVDLGGTLDRVRITTVDGNVIFDATLGAGGAAVTWGW
jgi:hypothetical protein